MNDVPEPILRKAIERLRLLGTLSEDSAHLVRRLLSPANRKATDLIEEWIVEAGMKVTRDVLGSLRGVLPGTHPNASPLLLGSHFDAAKDAGPFAGVLGIVVSLAAMEWMTEEGIHLPIPLHLLAFSDSGGGRFPVPYLASRMIVGEFDQVIPPLRDEGGMELTQAIEGEGEGRYTGAEPIHYSASSTRGYIEVHLEQGPVLEALDSPAGVVSAISGQTRVHVSLLGSTGHAGTTPMKHRRDALAAAAECLVAMEKLAMDRPPFQTTVSSFSIEPGTPDSIPRVAHFTLDLHHADDGMRADHLEKLRFACSTIARRRGLELEWRVAQDQDSVVCDAFLSQRLAGALTATVGKAPTLPSGIGHDGIVMSAIAPIAMLFVRCRGDHSYHANEHVVDSDIAVAIMVIHRFLKSFLVGI